MGFLDGFWFWIGKAAADVVMAFSVLFIIMAVGLILYGLLWAYDSYQRYRLRQRVKARETKK